MAVMTAREAAARLGVSTREVNRLVHRGALRGTKLGAATSAWLIDTRSLSEYQHIRKTGGRSWNAESSWATLNALSGVEQRLNPVTKMRIAERIRHSTAEEIARKTATRVKVRRFSADNREATTRELKLTGASAAEKVFADLVGRAKVVEGYVGSGDVADFIRRHLLIEDANGDILLYDTDHEVGADVPTAVVAADLARSTSTRERAAGVQVLEALRQRWIASNT